MRQGQRCNLEFLANSVYVFRCQWAVAEVQFGARFVVQARKSVVRQIILGTLGEKSEELLR